MGIGTWKPAGLEWLIRLFRRLRGAGAPPSLSPEVRAKYEQYARLMRAMGKESMARRLEDEISRGGDR